MESRRTPTFFQIISPDFARALRNGQSVNLMVNSQNPAIAFLKDMHLV
ncbi:MAG: hypothetical protein HY867_03465 [Chloroflexi bacterium]|nr:hypothetical protein [Chloroflexota bacterium]